MPRIQFKELPSSSRLWIFPAERPLSSDEEEALLAQVDEFLSSWAAHGAPLTGARDWRYRRFLIVGVDEASEAASGCSIDSMTNVMKGIGQELRVSFVDRSPVFYRESQEVRRVGRKEFQAMAEAGEVDLETIVFDNSIHRLFQLESGEWEKPAGASWHRRVFFRE